MSISIRRLTGRDFEDNIQSLARLRIKVFQEFPYIYDGSNEYEVQYLQKYSTSKKAALIAAFDEKVIIGAATCLPLKDEGAEVQNAFQNTEFDPEKIFYFGESVLEKKYRGKGIGKVFFEEREKWARSFQPLFNVTAFCAVERPADHKSRPLQYQPLDDFWKSRGYLKHPEIQTEFSWKDIGSAAETNKKMTFWLKKW